MPGDRKRTVQTEFKVKDSFSALIGKMAGGFQKAAGKLNELQSKFRDFRREQGLTTLGALGLGYGIGSWIEKTREANREFGHMQKGIAGVLAGSLKFEKGAGALDRYNRSMVLSKGISENLEQVSLKYQADLGDTEQTYRTLAASAGMLGINQKQLNSLTDDAIATQKAFGGAGDQAARVILRGFQTGKIKAIDPFTAAVSSAVGNMAKLTRPQRFEHIQRALQGSREIAAAMATGIDASLNRAQATVTGLLRDATGPLFGEIARSLDKWSKHLHEIREDGKPLVDQFAGKLVSAFHELEKISAFIKDHWMAIAGVKIGTSLGANAGRIAEMLGKLGGGLGAAGGVGAVNTGLAGMASQLGLVIGGLSAFKVGLDAVLGAVESHLDKERELDFKAESGLGSLGVLQHLAAKQKELGVLDERTSKFGTKAIEELKKSGLINNGKLDRGALAGAVTRLSGGEREKLADQLGIRNKYLPVSQMAGSQFADALEKQLSGFVEQYSARAAASAVTATKKDDKNLMFSKANTVINGNLNIEMKWEDQDPDRGFVRFQKKVQEGISKRRQPIGADGAAF